MTQKQFKIKSIQPISVDKLQPSPELLEVQNFLPISPEDRDRLKRDIEKSGEIRDPIKIYFDEDGKPLILGGFNRWHIAQELGWQFVPCEVMTVIQKERRELAIMDNLARRHMTREQKQKIVEMFLKNDPVQSNRVISKKTGVDDKTVGTVRKKLEATAEIPQLEKRAGADGRIRKAEPEKPSKKHVVNSSQHESEPLNEKPSGKKKILYIADVLVPPDRRPASVAVDLLNNYSERMKNKKETLQGKYLKSMIDGVFDLINALHRAGLVSDKELSQITKLVKKNS